MLLCRRTVVRIWARKRSRALPDLGISSPAAFAISSQFLLVVLHRPNGAPRNESFHSRGIKALGSAGISRVADIYFL